MGSDPEDMVRTYSIPGFRKFGKGFPDQLKGSDLSIPGERCYRIAWGGRLAVPAAFFGLMNNNGQIRALENTISLKG